MKPSGILAKEGKALFESDVIAMRVRPQKNLSRFIQSLHEWVGFHDVIPSVSDHLALRFRFRADMDLTLVC